MFWKPIALALAVSATMLAQGYGKTKWGMSKEEVALIYENSTLKPGDKMNEGEDIYFIKQAVFSTNSTIYFIFAKNKLTRVTIAPDCSLSDLDCMYKAKLQLSTNLENKYGPPNSIKKTLLGFVDRKWVLGETIILESSAVSRNSKNEIVMYDIHYTPRPNNDDDGL